MRLTNAKIKSLPIGKKVADGGGLYHQPTAVGRGKWTYRYSRNGKSREMGLGTYPEVTLAEARLTHAEQRKVFVGGSQIRYLTLESIAKYRFIWLAQRYLQGVGGAQNFL